MLTFASANRVFSIKKIGKVVDVGQFQVLASDLVGTKT